MKTHFYFYLITLFSLNLYSQAVITVDNRPNSGANFTAINDAIASASSGDIIQIHPSPTSYNNITLDRQLTLIGLGHNPANSSEDERAIVGSISITGNSGGSTITGLEINLISAGGVIVNCDNISVINNYILGKVSGIGVANGDTLNWLIEGNVFDSGFVQPGVSNQANNWVVKNNLFFDNNGQALVGFDNTCSFINNIVYNSSGTTISQSTDPIVNNNIFILENTIVEVGLNSSSVTFNNCMTYNTNGLTVTTLNGFNNYDNINPQFVNAPFVSFNDIYNNNYNVTNASAINGGTDGTDLGIFGALFNFDINGRPDAYPFMTHLAITNSSVEVGQDINVEFSAEKKN